MALEAAERQDYDAFHDLAWRALQKGPRNDPALMSMVARAQSLSGRPHDALVMLDRLAAIGVVTDAAQSDDFQRVRALPGWAALEARIAAIASPKPVPADPPAEATRRDDPASAKRGAAAAAAPTPSAAKPPDAKSPAPAPEPGKPADPSPADEPLAGDAGEALRFSTDAFTPAGLAYDAVSGRYIVGDLRGRKLTVVGEKSHRVNNLIGTQSAGFGEITALEIDPREGDLWVVSVAAEGVRSILHKLQLVSGRSLYSIDSDGPARFEDVAVSPTSAVVVLDREGRRLLRVAPRSRELRVAARLDVERPVSVAVASDTIAYVAHQAGVMRVDLGSQGTRALSAAKGIDLKGLAWIRWHQGAIVGVQAMPDGSGHRIVRLGIDGAGRRVTSLRVLDRSVRMPDPSAAAVQGDVLYYVAAAPPAPTDASGVETVVRRVTLR